MRAHTHQAAAAPPLAFTEEQTRRFWRPITAALATLGRYDEAVAFVDATARRRVGEAGAPRGAQDFSSGKVRLFKLRHDLEQLQYILDRPARGRPLSERDAQLLRRYMAGYRRAFSFLERHGRPDRIYRTEETVGTPAGGSIGAIYQRHFWHHPHEYPAFTDLALGPLNPLLDWAALEEEYLSGDPCILAVDDFLTPAALAAVREWLLEGTMWHQLKESYLGAYLEDGLASPLTLQMGNELRRRMPRVFGQHDLKTMW